MSQPKIDTETNSLIKEFISKLKMEGSSPRTTKAYSTFLTKFFMVVRKPVCQLTYELVLDWLETYQIGKAKRTINQRLAILAAFFAYCVGEELMDEVLVKPWWRPRNPSSIPKHLKTSESARLHLVIEQLQLRDRAILTIFLDTGLRRAEVSGINIEDIDFNNRKISVTVKGNKKLNVDFTEECCLILRQYLGDRKTGPLFLNKLSNRLSDRALYDITVAAGKLAGLLRPMGPHVLRHTFATDMLAKDVALGAVKEMLGHVSKRTTRIYARIPNDNLKNKYMKCMR